jgi:cysteine-rich repeat protein
MPPLSNTLRVGRSGAFALWLGLLCACGPEEGQGDRCGDGVLQGQEACDDGNLTPSDGCSPLCVVEDGWRCIEGLPCTTVCGDSIVAGGETCDDGNTIAGDGCSSACQIEREDTETDCADAVDNDGNGLVDCNDPACASSPLCVPVEDCTDGMDNDGNRLVDCDDPACFLDGRCVGEEVCDNGRDDNGNGLVDCDDPDCDCAPPGCGDGVRQGDEACDSGPANSDTTPDACRTNCRLPACGDGVVDAEEECDEGAANGAAGACTATCRRNLLQGCGLGTGINFFDQATALSPRHFRLEGRISPGSGNDLAPPVSCNSVNGPDVVLAVTAPTDAFVVLRTIPSLTTVPLTMMQLDGCGAEAAVTGCERASVSTFLTADLESGQTYYFALDAALAGGGRFGLEVLAVDVLRGLGDSCDPDSLVAICASGTLCRPVGSEGDFRCQSPPAGVLGPGEECRPGAADAVCETGLTCLAGQCTAAEGRSCATASDELPIGVDQPEVFLEYTPGAFYQRVPSTCGGAAPDMTVLPIRAAGEGELVVRGRSAGDAAIALSLRQVCQARASELACVQDAGVSVLRRPVAAGERLFLHTESAAAASLSVRILPWVAEGAPCDRDRDANVCRPPLVCDVDGTCRSALPGTCGAPVDLAGEGEGELEGRGRVVTLDGVGVADQWSVPCATAEGLDWVAAFESTGLGFVTVEWIGAPEAAAMSLHQGCDPLQPATVACAEPEGPGSVSIKRTLVQGGLHAIVLHTRSFTPLADPGVLIVQYEPAGRFAQPCEPTVGCRPGMQCIVPLGETGFVCDWFPRGPGERCTEGEAPCIEGYRCVGVPGSSVCEASP